ncbi:CDP-diacylglycerol diphosphatase [Serratia marcescens]|uniref:CDP-diacylglycerol diphosphatase n=1 Tax=Serratia marcescens TaxID=615 RepID=UPI0009A54E1F|nr:CDP-diacylglycerol diphosphatase [Serratia marcescens]OPJ99441.1 hypothetical protein B1R44_06965 [Serratia marcescens]
MKKNRLFWFKIILLSQMTINNSAYAADRTVLAQTVNHCEDIYLQNNTYGNCSVLNHELGYAVLKSTHDDYHYLLLPLTQISGIEDPQLLNSKTLPWFYISWQEKALLSEKVLRKMTYGLAESDIALTINPMNARSQDRMHIHISCLDPLVKASLDKLVINYEFISGWGEVTLQSARGPLSYFAKKISVTELREGNIFEIVKNRWGDNMRYATITVVQNNDSYLLLVRVGDNNHPAYAEELQDHSCSISRSPGKLFPLVPSATGDNGWLLTRDNYYRLPALTVSVPAYTGMEIGQKVGVRWKGPNHTYDTALQSVTRVSPLNFQIPREEFIDGIGGIGGVSFSIENNDNEIIRSATLPLKLEDQPLTLPPPSISQDLHTVTVSYKGMTQEHCVSVRLDGVSVHKTETQRGNNTGELLFTIPDDWITENHGREISINYSVITREDSRYQFSHMLWENIPSQ